MEKTQVTFKFREPNGKKEPAETRENNYRERKELVHRARQGTGGHQL